MTVTDTSPLVKTRDLACPADHAFDVYVGRIAEWWPLATHSVYGDDASGLVVEPGVGGRIVESGPDGAEAVWGTLTAWEPKRRLAHTWHPGEGPETATAVEVRFEPAGDGCVLTLTHSGWDGAGVTSVREGYDEGWPPVLDAYAGLVIR
jgi:hypothetical protein